MELSNSISVLKYIGKNHLDKLNSLNIYTIKDLLYFFPVRYDDYSLLTSIASIQEEETVSIYGSIESITNVYTKTKKNLQIAKISDTSGSIKAVWFNQKYLLNIFKKNVFAYFSGKVIRFNNSLTLSSPKFEIKKNDDINIHTAGIIPVYHQTEGLTSRWIRSRIYSILNSLNINEYDLLPLFIKRKYNLITLDQALHQIHFPTNKSLLKKSIDRLSFEELFNKKLIIYLNKIKNNNISNLKFSLSKKNELKKIIDTLPFNLTTSQQKCLNEIMQDLSSNINLNRLLQGDVGSGKTVVAALAAYFVHLNGYRTIFLSPTKVLTNQHFQTIKEIFKKEKFMIELFSEKNKSLLKNHLIIGTHALLFSKKKFTDVGLVIIDEQQKFGVDQRKEILNICDCKNILNLTATPIPRTQIMSFFSDMQISYITEVPKGRLRVKTYVVSQNKKNDAYKWIRNKIKNDPYPNQAFFVYPFIDQSEKLISIKSATQEYNNFKKNVFSDLKIELLHSKIDKNKQDEIITKFKKGNIQMLVATSIIEVGMDIPQATIIVIEEADRFGLSQLHQLRGRVGRNNIQSYCLLFTQKTDENIIKRLKLLEKIYSGSDLAYEDLKIRGFGEIFGFKQHGLSDLKLADLTDQNLLDKVNLAFNDLVNFSSDLSKFPLLIKALNKYKIMNISLN